MILDWLDLTQILLLLVACYTCFLAGKFRGVHAIIDLLLEKNLIKESDLDKLTD
jgi:hypothetical protein